jgi:hypothetical protein
MTQEFFSSPKGQKGDTGEFNDVTEKRGKFQAVNYFQVKEVLEENVESKAFKVHQDDLPLKATLASQDTR